MTITRQEALDYHRPGRPGKIAIAPTKPLATQRDLSLAYTPGVAEPVLEIEREPDSAFEYTARGNLVAVVSNGTAILGLGDRGALASKPVMEGKGVLFKAFADVDVFDIEVNTRDPEEMIRVVAAIAPPSAASTWRISRPPSVSWLNKGSRGCWTSLSFTTTNTARRSSPAPPSSTV